MSREWLVKHLSQADFEKGDDQSSRMEAEIKDEGCTPAGYAPPKDELIMDRLKHKVNYLKFTMGHVTATEYVLGAIKTRSVSILNLCIKTGVDVNVSDKHGNTALMLAAEQGDVICVKMLLNAKAKISAKDVGRLSDAGVATVVAAIQAIGRDEKAVQSALSCCLHMNQGVFVANRKAPKRSRAGIVSRLKVIHAVNGYVNEGKYEYEIFFKGFLQTAARVGVVENLKMGIKAGHDINKRDELGLTALACAAEQGNANAVDFLIQAGADINLRDKDGDTALMLAAEQGELACVKKLLYADAKISGEDITRLSERGFETIKVARQAIEQDKKARRAVVEKLDGKTTQLVVSLFMKETAPQKNKQSSSDHMSGADEDSVCRTYST